MGFRSIEDTNSPDAFCDGISTLDLTVDQNNQRVSVLEAYLPKATVLKRESNLTICTGALVSSVDFSVDQTETRAQRVNFQYAKPTTTKETFSVTVNREVIISSGALGSPQILMLRSVISSSLE
jgi:choline dehydrogenase